ncbi:MAG: hypothetical protein ABI193_04295 [Minicystis sp.]
MSRTLENEAPDTIFEELVATEAALLADPDAADLAPPISAKIEEWETTTYKMRNVSRAETASKAVAVLRDAELDDTVIDFGDELLRAVDKDRDAPRFKRYFKQSPSRFVKIARLVEATTVESWIPSIQKEPEPELVAFAAPLEQQSKASLDALAQFAAAAGERASTRVLLWDSFVKSVDAARDLLYADLVKVGQKKKRGRDWPDRFFRTVTRERAAKATDGAPAGNDAPAGDNPPGG